MCRSTPVFFSPVLPVFRGGGHIFRHPGGGLGVLLPGGIGPGPGVLQLLLPVFSSRSAWRAARRADMLRRVAFTTCHTVTSTTTARPIQPAVRMYQKSRMVNALLYMPR